MFDSYCPGALVRRPLWLPLLLQLVNAQHVQAGLWHTGRTGKPSAPASGTCSALGFSVCWELSCMCEVLSSKLVSRAIKITDKPVED
jgi:hypothetical protein